MLEWVFCVCLVTVVSSQSVGHNQPLLLQQEASFLQDQPLIGQEPIVLQDSLTLQESLLALQDPLLSVQQDSLFLSQNRDPLVLQQDSLLLGQDPLLQQQVSTPQDKQLQRQAGAGRQLGTLRRQQQLLQVRLEQERRRQQELTRQRLLRLQQQERRRQQELVRQQARLRQAELRQEQLRQTRLRQAQLRQTQQRQAQLRRTQNQLQQAQQQAQQQVQQRPEQLQQAPVRRQQVARPSVPTVYADRDGPFQDGTYYFTYLTGDGIDREEGARLTGPLTHEVTGSYSYTAPNGEVIIMEYIADERGYRAFPVRPGRPRQVLRPQPIPVTPPLRPLLPQFQGPTGAGGRNSLSPDFSSGNNRLPRNLSSPKTLQSASGEPSSSDSEEDAPAVGLAN